MGFDDEKAIEQTERQRRNREEVEVTDYFVVVVEKCKPSLGFTFVTVPPQAVEIARDGRLGNMQSQLEQFAVDASRTPGPILPLHAADQVANLPTDFRSPECTLPRPPPPKQLESSAMAGNHGFSLYTDQVADPLRPYSTEGNPQH